MTTLQTSDFRPPPNISAQLVPPPNISAQLVHLYKSTKNAHLGQIKNIPWWDALHYPSSITNFYFDGYHWKELKTLTSQILFINKLNLGHFNRPLAVIGKMNFLSLFAEAVLLQAEFTTKKKDILEHNEIVCWISHFGFKKGYIALHYGYLIIFALLDDLLASVSSKWKTREMRGMRQKPLMEPGLQDQGRPHVDLLVCGP